MNSVSYGLSEQRVSEQRAPLTATGSLLVGASPAMQEVFRLIERVGPTEANVLLTGESGSGKELAAQSIHERSARRDRAGLEVGFQLRQPNEASPLFRTAEAGIEWAVAQKVMALHGGELLERNEGPEAKSLVIFLPLCP